MTKLPDEKNIPERLREVMRKHDLSQSALARALEVDPSYVSRILSGDRDNLKWRVLERLELLEKRGPIDQATTTDKAVINEVPPDTSARSYLRAAREAAGLSREELSRLTKYQIGVIQAVEESGARITEKMVDSFARAIPGLDKGRLLEGSDFPRIVADSRGTVGSKPTIATPPGVEARYVPLISWAQCGHLADFEDIYEYEGYLAFNVQDRRAIAVTLKGDSMEPRFREGDVAIVYPSRKAQTGNLVIAKIRDEGIVFKKFQILSRQPARFRFISENPDYEPIERDEEEIEWIYPVANVVNNVL